MFNLPVEYDKLSTNERRLVREQYIREQGGNCYHCKAPLKIPAPESIQRIRITKNLFPINFFDNPIHLHHNHETGLTIGAVHCHCNAVLWEHYGE